MSTDDLLLLRMARDEARNLEYRLERARERRDALALAAVDRGHTWRAVANAAGFANPYIARLKRTWRERTERPA